MTKMFQFSYRASVPSWRTFALAVLLGILAGVPNFALTKDGSRDAGHFGFSPEANGSDNAESLQKAVEQGGTITVSKPGIYKIANTVLIGSNTSLVFGSGVVIQKVNEGKPFSHVLLNKGALTKKYDRNISITGLTIQVNGVDHVFREVYGLRGQLAFFYVKDLEIRKFRLADLGSAQYGIHVCAFEDLIIEDVMIEGRKDGIHLGRGKRFAIRDCKFKTVDDAIALNAHDYATSNPELGWIEDGVIERCYDLQQDGEKIVGFFCRILAGAWTDWKSGMEVQQSDTVVSAGRLYRVQANADGRVYKSTTRPDHTSGNRKLDRINWGVVQDEITYTAGVRRVVFRDIYLEKPRTGFSVHFDNNHYSRSYYPGAPVVKQEQLLFDNVRVLHNRPTDLFSIGTPVDVISITHCVFNRNKIKFKGNKAIKDYLTTRVNITGSVFMADSPIDFITNSVDGKKVIFTSSSNIILNDNFVAHAVPGPGQFLIESDLPGLNDDK